jgi:Na+/melibiose symporter-like transporter
VIIILYFVASTFIVIGFMMLFAFHRTRRWEMVLLSFVYSGSGLAAAYSLQWWPLIAGFVVAWLLKFAGYDPDKPPKRAWLQGRSSADDSPPGN